MFFVLVLVGQCLLMFCQVLNQMWAVNWQPEHQPNCLCIVLFTLFKDFFCRKHEGYEKQVSIINLKVVSKN